MGSLKMLEEGTYEEWKPKFPHGNAKKQRGILGRFI